MSYWLFGINYLLSDIAIFLFIICFLVGVTSKAKTLLDGEK